MKFTSAIVLAALLNLSEVEGIRMPTKFIDDSDIQLRDEPAGDAIQKRLDSDKAAAKSAEAKKNDSKNAKALGEKMKKAKEEYDEKMEKKADAENAAKEKAVDDAKKANVAMLDKNKAAMDNEMAKTAAMKAKPASE